MNILYIHTHDTGKFIQPYGYQVETPNLMKFAERGTVFRSAFSAAPTCSPSRAALLTGEYPHNCGMFGLAHRGFEMEDYSHHIASYLKSFGYVYKFDIAIYLLVCLATLVVCTFISYRIVKKSSSKNIIEDMNYIE